jgi:hypothetical protein
LIRDISMHISSLWTSKLCTVTIWVLAGDGLEYLCMWDGNNNTPC